MLCVFIKWLPVLRFQVMKMVMTLSVQQSGCIHFIKRPGAVLVPGCMMAHMDLDDPSSIHRVCKKNVQTHIGPSMSNVF